MQADNGFTYTHADCSHNTQLALKNRHLYNPLYDPNVRGWRVRCTAGVKPVEAQLLRELRRRDSCPQAVRGLRKNLECKRVLEELANDIKDQCANSGLGDPAPWPLKRVVDHYTGGKREEYLRAYKKLIKDGLKDTDVTSVTMFLKDDKYWWDNDGGAEGIKAPRCIQYRSKAFNIIFGSIIHPLEKVVYPYLDRAGTPVFAKSRNSHQRAADIKAKLEATEYSYAYLIDHSKFDAHVTEEHLAQTRYFYSKFFPHSKVIQMLEKAHGSWVNGYTKKGLHYQVLGTRMSGDMDTGLGNSLINYVILKLTFPDGSLLYIDGDDSIVFTRRKVDKDYIVKMCREHGMEAKVEEVVNPEMEDMDFCQSRPVLVSGRWRCVREPMRVLKRMGWITKRRDDKFLERVKYSIGLCELALNQGVPILQHAALEYVANSTNQTFTTEVDRYFAAKNEFFRPGKARPLPVTMETRLSFERAFGITVAKQLEMESWKFSKDLVVVRPFEDDQYLETNKTSRY